MDSRMRSNLALQIYRYLARIALLSMMIAMAPGNTAAKPCEPSDPTGENPGNLCLTYPTHGMTIDSYSFRQGFASEGYYGTALGPNQPGAPIQLNHHRGTPIDPNSGRPGYWTQIEASEGRIQVKTDSGRTWQRQIKR